MAPGTVIVLSRHAPRLSRSGQATAPPGGDHRSTVIVTRSPALIPRSAGSARDNRRSHRSRYCVVGAFIRSHWLTRELWSSKSAPASPHVERLSALGHATHFLPDVATHPAREVMTRYRCCHSAEWAMHEIFYLWSHECGSLLHRHVRIGRSAPDVQWCYVVIRHFPLRVPAQFEARSHQGPGDCVYLRDEDAELQPHSYTCY